MQAVIVAIFTWVLGSAVAKLLIGAGITLLTAGGVYSIVQAALDGLATYFGGLPGGALQFVILTGVPQGLSLIGSAILTRTLMSAGGRIIGAKISGGS